MNEENQYNDWLKHSFSIPGEVAFNPNLSDIDKRVYWVIHQFALSPKGIFPSNEYLAYVIRYLSYKHKKINITTVSLSVSNLIKEGYLKRKAFDGRKRVLEICDPTKKHKKFISDFDTYRRAFVNRQSLPSSEDKYNNNKFKGLSKERPDIHSVNVTALGESSNNDTSTQSQSTPILKRRKRTTLSIDPTPIVDSLSTDNSLSSKQKEIIRYWNIQPNTKHMRLPNGNKPTKIYNRVTRKILPTIIDDYPLSEIKQSIKTYSDILGDQRNFGLREEVIGHKVGPDEFFKGFSNDTKSRMFDSNIVKKSTVWFLECMKSRSYLEETYGHWIEDPNSKVTQEFREMFLYPLTPTTHGNRIYPHPPEWYEVEFKESQAAELNGVSIVEENLFRLATKRLLQFMETYEIGSKNSPIQTFSSNPVHFVVAVYRTIAEEVNGGTFKPNIGWIAATKTYEERLPNLFKCTGEMKANVVPLQMPWKDYTEKRV